MEAVLYFKFKCLSLSIENTLAASVDEITAPISTLLIQENFITKYANTATNIEVSTTPTLDSRPAFNSTGLASFIFVPNPP